MNANKESNAMHMPGTPETEPAVDYRPRLILWQLTPEDRTQQMFSTQECLLTIDGIARVSKPIVVLTPPDVLMRDDLYEIVEYGFALGLKMIIEAKPGELTDSVIRRYRQFGPRVFRIIVSGSVIGDPDTRYRQSPEYHALESAVHRLRAAGFEIHLGATMTSPDRRELAYYHDFAFRSAATGLYCHMCFGDGKTKAHEVEHEHDSLGDFLEAFPRMKRQSPGEMYLSPQCVRYASVNSQEAEAFDLELLSERDSHAWLNLCLAGKTFAFITPEGKVLVCDSMHAEGGDLRQCGYQFRTIWELSPVFRQLRDHRWSCCQTREHLHDDLD